MATPVADTYSSAGQTLVVGRFLDRLMGNVVLAGDSLTALSYQSAGYRVGFPLTMYPPKIVYNAGVAGDTIQNLINRFAADVASKNAQVAVIRIGTNGPGGGTYQEKYTTLFGLLSAANLFGVFHAVPPKGLGTNGVDSPFIAQNLWLKNQCELQPTKLAFVEDSNSLGDSFYNALPSFYITAEAANPIHMNGKGVYTQGVAMQSIYQGLFEPVEARLLDASEIGRAHV